MGLRLIFSITFIVFFTSMVFVANVWSQVEADGTTVEVTNPWIKYNPMSGRASAAYFDIKNVAILNMEIIGVLAPNDIHAMMHKTVEENGRMRMLSLKSVKVAMDESVVFAPRGKHIMLMNMPSDLKIGSTLNLTIKLGHGERLNVPFKVCPLTALQSC